MSRQLLGGCVIATGAAAAAIAWWLVGDVSEPGLFSPDHIIESPDVSPITEALIGVVGVIAASIALLVLWRGRRAAVITRRQLSAVVPIAGLGAFAGFTLRVVTAGVSGANIGAGLLMMGSVVVVPVMLGLASLLWRRDRPDASS
ncbi:MAG: hypothetical protein WA964_15005 [Ilumatobacter sp.]|uniref:hypothetical protein n=1 Tax=Ilumatobacter sp. TaxID=1967498 RepID=UPI003C752CB9